MNSSRFFNISMLWNASRCFAELLTPTYALALIATLLNASANIALGVAIAHTYTYVHTSVLSRLEMWPRIRPWRSRELPPGMLWRDRDVKAFWKILLPLQSWAASCARDKTQDSDIFFTVLNNLEKVR